MEISFDIACCGEMRCVWGWGPETYAKGISRITHRFQETVPVRYEVIDLARICRGNRLPSYNPPLAAVLAKVAYRTKFPLSHQRGHWLLRPCVPEQQETNDAFSVERFEQCLKKNAAKTQRSLTIGQSGPFLTLDMDPSASLARHKTPGETGLIKVGHTQTSQSPNIYTVRQACTVCGLLIQETKTIRISSNRLLKPFNSGNHLAFIPESMLETLPPISTTVRYQRHWSQR